MRQGKDSLFLRQVGRLAADTKDVDTDTMTDLVEEIVPVLAGLCGTFSKLAVLAGALVERGASPLALAEVLPERAVITMARYSALRRIWPEAAHGRPLPEFSPPLNEAALNEVEGTLVAYADQRGMPKQQALLVAYSWFSVNDWINPLISAMVDREFRHVMQRRGQVRDGAAALMDHSERARWLYGLSVVCDDEVLVVLDSTSGRGFRLTMSGVGDNYQLHTLLADRLMIPGHGGLLEGERPEPAWVEAAGTGRSGPFTSPTPITRRFRLFDGHGSYVSPEAWPAEIEPLDGTRVLVLHPPKGSYGWMHGRSYVDMVPFLTLDREIEPTDAARWLSRITPARETDLMGLNRD
jgi:hypothetical protein